MIKLTSLSVQQLESLRGGMDWRMPRRISSSSPSNDREAIQKTGSSCPLGWFGSGSYCVKNSR